MGGGSPSHTTTTNEPPAFIQPFMQFGAQQSRGLYETGGPKYYPGETVVPFSSQTQQALDRTQQRATNGSPVTNAAQGYSTDVLSGKYLPGGENQNPYLDATFNRGADQVQNRVQSAFAGSGRNVNAGRAPAAMELNDLANQVYGGAYQNERQAQQAMVPFATGLANNDYTDLQALQGVGGQYEDLNARQMQDSAARYDFAQNAPQRNLDSYLGRITGAYPGGSQTTPTYQNHTAGALGGAMAGAQVGSSFGPYGTAIGAIAGGLLGYQ